MKVAQELKEPHIPRQVGFAHAAKHAQIRLEQGEQALRAILVHVPTRVFLLRMIDELVHVALHRPVAAGRVRRESTPRLDGEVSGLLHRLDGEIAGRLDYNGSLATDPGNDGRPVFVIVAPARLALLTPATRPAPQGLLPAVVRLAFLASRVIQVIRLNDTLQLPIGLVGDSRITQPPAPAIARVALDP